MVSVAPSGAATDYFVIAVGVYPQSDELRVKE